MPPSGRPEGGVEEAERRPARLADRGLAAGQRGTVRRWATRCQPVSVIQKKLAAPDRAVRAVAGAVPGDAEDRRRKPVARPCRRRRGRRDAGRRRPAARSPRRSPSSDSRDGGRGRRCAGAMPCRLRDVDAGVVVGVARLRRIEVAEVLAEHDAGAEGERNGRPSDGRRGRGCPAGMVVVDLHGRRRIAAGAAEEERPSGDHAGQPNRRPAGRSAGRGRGRQSAMPASRRERLALVDDDRLVGAVAAGRDHRENRDRPAARWWSGV